MENTTALDLIRTAEHTLSLLDGTTNDTQRVIDFSRNIYEAAQQTRDLPSRAKLYARIVPHLDVLENSPSVDTKKVISAMIDAFVRVGNHHEDIETVVRKRIDNETNPLYLLNLYNTLAVHYLECDMGEEASDVFEKALPYVSMLERTRTARYDEYGMTVPTLADFFIVAVSAFASSKKFQCVDTLLNIVQNLSELSEIVNIYNSVAIAYLDSEECNVCDLFITNDLDERAVNVFEQTLAYALQVFQKMDYCITHVDSGDIIEDRNGFEVAQPRSYFVNFFSALAQLERWDQIEQYARMIASEKGKEAVTSILSELMVDDNSEKFVNVMVSL
jgi:hypothetical protein